MKAGGVFRRSNTNTRKASNSPEPSAVIDGGSLFRLCLHAAACIACLIVGFRFSREAQLVLVLRHHQDASSAVSKSTALDLSSRNSISENDVGLRFPYVSKRDTQQTPPSSSLSSDLKGKSKSSRVSVGRHEILVRPWPHPDSLELHRADELLRRVQQEQRNLYSPQYTKPIIAITPTYVRTFQAIHLSSVFHTLALIPGEVIWIVVEAGGKSNETFSLLQQSLPSNLHILHLATRQRMPAAASWEKRRAVETQMRVEGLRYVRENKVDGMVVFVDDSNVHSLELFDEVQKVKWVGAASVGLMMMSNHNADEFVPVQGPACNASNVVIGWHLMRTSPITDGGDSSDAATTAATTSAATATAAAAGIIDIAKHIEWAGFVFNSRAIWIDGGDKPTWLRDWNEWINGGDATSPLRLVKDETHVEAMGNCGREVLLWWLRVEARSDSRFPHRWMLDPPLDVTVASKRTPWPEATPPPIKRSRKKRSRIQQQQQQH